MLCTSFKGRCRIQLRCSNHEDACNVLCAGSRKKQTDFIGMPTRRIAMAKPFQILQIHCLTAAMSGGRHDTANPSSMPMPEGCSTWQHRKTLHLLAAEGKGIFVCGRPKSGAHVEAEERPTLILMRCSQCDKGKRIKSTAQLVHFIKCEGFGQICLTVGHGHS